MTAVQKLYFVETSSPRIRGAWFVEIDRDSNSRAFALSEVRRGEAVKVLEVIEPCDEYPRGQVLDVTNEMKAEVGVLSQDYRTTLTGEDLAAWQRDRARALAMAE